MIPPVSRDIALKVIPNFCLNALTGMKTGQELNLVRREEMFRAQFGCT